MRGAVPDYASLHPGYKLTSRHGPKMQMAGQGPAIANRSVRLAPDQSGNTASILLCRVWALNGVTM
jgi:hypothetical protein